MKIKIAIEKTDIQCSPQIVSLNIPAVEIDIWLCITVFARFFFWHQTLKWAIHLV